VRPIRRTLVGALCLAVTGVTLTTLTLTGVTRPADASPGPSAPGSAGTQVTLVALGDSWAAGTAAGGAPLVDPAGANGATCRRTEASYPAQAGPRLAPQAWTSRACASTTGGPDTQFDALTPAATRVTITVGADATALGALTSACATGSARTDCDAAATRTDHALDALGPALDTSLAEIHRRAPHAGLVVTTYPRLSEGLTCAAGAADTSAARRVDTAVTRLDGILTDRARAARAVVVDVRDAFAAHGSCDAEPWVTPFAGSDPLRSGAPTAAGQAALARLVGEAKPRPAAADTAAPDPAPSDPATSDPAASDPVSASASASLRVAPGRLLAPLFGH
jgi:hypothetical protein